MQDRLISPENTSDQSLNFLPPPDLVEINWSSPQEAAQTLAAYFVCQIQQNPHLAPLITIPPEEALETISRLQVFETYQDLITHLKQTYPPEQSEEIDQLLEELEKPFSYSWLQGGAFTMGCDFTDEAIKIPIILTGNFPLGNPKLTLAEEAYHCAEACLGIITSADVDYHSTKIDSAIIKRLLVSFIATGGLADTLLLAVSSYATYISAILEHSTLPPLQSTLPPIIAVGIATSISQLLGLMYDRQIAPYENSSFEKRAHAASKKLVEQL